MIKMVEYSSEDKLVAGVPLGGIGAGKIEINNKGKIVNVTIFNNKGFPIPNIRGFHILIKPDDGNPFFLEKDLPFISLKNLESDIITYRGLYPFIYLIGIKNKIRAKLTAFSPLIPKNIKDSTLPAVGFSLKIEGSNSGLIAISFPNIVGSNPIGRVNRSDGDKIIFTNLRSIDTDPRKGEIVLMGDTTDLITQYNINVKPEIALKNKSWKEKFENEDPWKSIINGEKYKDDVHEVSGLWDDPAGMLITRYNKDSEIKFVLSWYIRGKHVLYPYGTYYQKNFSSAIEIAEYFYKNFEKLRNQSADFHKIVYNNTDLPEWLKDAIINSAYILSSNTIFDDKGRFSIYESPEVCPCVGTIAALCYEGGSLPLLLLFPELEKSFLTLLANNMREDGYVPHDLGIHSLDHPVDGTTSPPKWKDTNPTFILLVYRYYKFTNDLDFLKEMYPKMLKAMKWELTQDKDKDGVPELEGQGDTGFDAMSVKGIDSYTTSIYIASIIALKETAKILKDNDTLNEMTILLEKARKVFSRLFNGKYFNPWIGEPEIKGIFLGQLVGEWWSEILGLESITEEEKISSALEAMLSINANSSNFCTPNIVSEDGKIIDISPQSYSSWPRLVFAIGSIGYKRNKKWIDVVKKEWENLVKKGIVWNQPSRINGFTGYPDPEIYLDHYIGNASIWSFLLIK
ncbi:GH116 family glycosyl hydrolase [Saccharolobus caldissimus]|nr:GH116 family glycosyl hydrolase [Saccharolobus caldissimus]